MNSMVVLALVVAMMVGVVCADPWCSEFRYDYSFSTWLNDKECADCCRHYLAMHNGGYISNQECYCN